MTWNSLSADDKAAIARFLAEGNTPEELAEQLAEMIFEYTPKEAAELLNDAMED